MTGRRKYWVVVCPKLDNIYGPLQSDLHATKLLLDHCGGLMGVCGGGITTRRHAIVQLVDPSYGVPSEK